MNDQTRRLMVLLPGVLLLACGPGAPEECEGPSSGKSEPCCVSYGKDACGAGLFCGAFDGRVVNTCYELKSRKGQEKCTANEQCQSDSCAPSAGVCQSVVGERCAQNTDCAQTLQRFFVACVAGACAVQTGACGDKCERSSQCTQGMPCTMGVCGYPEGATYSAPAYGPSACCLPGLTSLGVCSGAFCERTCR